MKSRLFQLTGLALLTLGVWLYLWIKPAIPPTILTPESMYSNVQGLFATYWNTVTPTQIKNPPVLLQRIDRTIDFNWSKISPDPRVPLINYSVQWQGSVLADRAGTYRISTYSDDGVRLWLDGKLQINDWRMHGVDQNNATVYWKKGWHSIGLDYLQLFGNSEIHLLWTPPGGQTTFIPSDHLSPLPTSANGHLLTTGSVPTLWFSAWVVTVLFIWGLCQLLITYKDLRMMFRRFLAVSGLMLGGTLVGGLLVEGLFHVIPNNYVKNVQRDEYMKRRNVIQFIYGTAHPDPQISYLYIPDIKGIFLNDEFMTKVRFNHLGFRGPHISLTPSPSRRRLLVIGDSFAFGWGVEENETFVERLNQAHRNWEAVNLGISGISTREEWGILRWYGPMFHPQDIIIALYANDVPDCVGQMPKFPTLPRNLYGHRQIKPKTTKTFYLPGFLKDYKFRKSTVVEYWRQSDPRAVDVCGSFFLLIKDWCLNHHAKLHVVYIPYKEEIQEKVPVANHKAMLEFWEKNQIDWVDMTPEIQRLKDPYAAYFPMDDHMTRLGQSLVAQVLLAHIK